MKTQNRYNIIFYVLLSMASVVGMAQDADESDAKTIQFSLVYPIGTNGQQSHRVANDISLNLIAGYNGAVNSVEVGGIYNITRKYVRGLQLSGFGNAVGGEVRGVQLAGFINTNKGFTQGAQLAGFVNLSGGHVSGAELAGFFNLAESNKGLQIAGFGNLNKAIQGVQSAGFINISGDVKGAQLAGFINIAKQLRGVQVGFINISDSVGSGAQVGLINIARKNGFISLGLETDEAMPYRLAFRSGMDYFYTVLTVGVDASDDYWSWGAGLGSRLFLSQKRTVFINPEVRWEQISDGKIDYDDFSHLTKLNMNVGYHFHPNFYLTAGPSLNFYVTNDLDQNGNPKVDLSSHQTYDKLNGGNRYQLWFGYNVGLGFKF